MDLQFLLDRYKWELDRREKISAAVNFPVTILILVFSLLGALLPKLQLVAPQVVLPVVGLFFLAGGCGVVSLWHFIRSYQGSKYSYLPLLADLETTQEEWRAFYQEAHADGADEDFFAHEFRRHIIDAADRNTGSNDRRQAFLERGNIALVWMFVATALCAAGTYLSVIFKG
ncbi:MAG: hypothetical protein HY047_07030 [Acidobacteria bacterium]|nr:hypothetical protein [Acidobacteriota bacterium]